MEPQPRKPSHCPGCKSTKVRFIIWGRPNESGMAKLEREEATLGGCFCVRHAPNWHCADCHHRWADETDPWRIELLELEDRIFARVQAKRNAPHEHTK